MARKAHIMRDSHRPNEIEIQSPCPKSWASLVGGEQKRFCSECELHVHNSEALTRADAESLARSQDGRVCMRIVRDQEGAPIYLDSNVRPVMTSGPAPSRETGGPVRALPRAAGWILAASAGLMSACTDEVPADPTQGAEVGCTVEVPGALMGLVRVDQPEVLGEAAWPEEMGDIAPSEHAPSMDPIQDEAECVQDSEAPHEIMGRVAAPRGNATPED